MCGRYEIPDSSWILKRFHVPSATTNLVLPANLDVRPTQTVPVLLTDHQLALMRWGLIPFWSHDTTNATKMINARAETVAEKPSFKRLLRTQRCILPAAAFFGWKDPAPTINIPSPVICYQSGHFSWHCLSARRDVLCTQPLSLVA